MPTPVIIGNATLYCGDCRAALAGMADNSVDAVVCDPPYGLGNEPDINAVLDCWLSGNVYRAKGGGFMGKAWDAFVPGPDVWREVYRVLKPGGHLLAFAGTRTVDVMGIALRLVGFERRDLLCWTFGSGFSKSMNISKKLDSMAGAEREVVGVKTRSTPIIRSSDNQNYRRWHDEKRNSDGMIEFSITAPATELAKQWDGWGSALKPALEPILCCRKPISEATIAANVVKWGTGGLAIDKCRVHIDESVDDPRLGGKGYWYKKEQPSGIFF
jgi:site-specific DNA-methyltransferase (adenine-specific)